jgi:DNA/RNA endonuclease YhcR with UshA esterase domain
MRSIIVLLFSLFSVACAKAQTSIKLEEVSKHVGDSVTVCGLVADMRYFENSKNKPTLLNIGAKHPDAPLTVVIWENARALFTTSKVEDLLNKNICITGRIVLYKEKPEIIIEIPGQIVVQ